MRLSTFTRLFGIGALAMSSAMTVSARDITWDGGAGDQTDANWTDSDLGTPGNTLASLAGVGGPRIGDLAGSEAARFIIDGAGSHVTFNRNAAGGDFRPRQGVEMIVSNGAIWEQATPATDTENGWTEMDISKLTIDGGTYRRSGRALEHPDRGDDGGGALIFGSWRSDDRKATYGDPVIDVALTNGGKIDNEGQLWFGAYLDHDPALSVQMSISGNSSLDLKGGEISLDNSGIAVEGDLIFTYRSDGMEDYGINFTGPGSITVSAAGIKEVSHDGTGFIESNLLSYQDLWTSGILKWNGSSSGNFSDFFDVTGSVGSNGYKLSTKSAANPCDLNGDTNLDAADAGIMFGNWGNAGVGDCNNDNIVDAADAGALFGGWTGDPVAGDGQAAGEYNVVTGQISVHANNVVNWYIQSTSGGLTGAAVGDLPGPGLVTDNNSRVGETALGKFSYEANLGNVAAAGLPEGDLVIYWNSDLGRPLQNAPVAYVPEPASMLLCGLSLLGLGLARRR